MSTGEHCLCSWTLLSLSVTSWRLLLDAYIARGGLGCGSLQRGGGCCHGVVIEVVVAVVIRASVVVELDVDVDAGALVVQFDVVVVIGDFVEAVVECLHSSWRSWLWQSSARWWWLSWWS
jgi:hypothetical protein